MNCYFLSDIPSYLKINGEYKGIASVNLSSISLDREECFFEFLPFSSNYQSCYGNSSNHTLRVFNVKGNKIVYPVFHHLPTLPFKFIAQKTDSYHGQPITVTVYQDGVVKFFIDGVVNDIKSLPFLPYSIEIKFYLNYVFISFHDEKIALFVFSHSVDKEKFLC